MSARRGMMLAPVIGGIVMSLAVATASRAQGLGIPGQPVVRQGSAATRGGGAVAPVLQMPGQMQPPIRRQTGGQGIASSPTARARTMSASQFSVQNMQNRTNNVGTTNSVQRSSRQLMQRSRNVRRW